MERQRRLEINFTTQRPTQPTRTKVNETKPEQRQEQERLRRRQSIFLKEEGRQGRAGERMRNGNRDRRRMGGSS
jgi:hypothetical protein